MHSINTENILKSCIKNQIGTIDIKDAHIWFFNRYVNKKNQPLPSIHVFKFLSPEDRDFSVIANKVKINYCHDGACNSEWNAKDENELIDDLKELLIQLGCGGGKMNEMVLQLAKIKQFAALGSESRYIARTLSNALVGFSYEALDVWDVYQN